MEDMKPLLQLVFHCVDKVFKLRLGKEVEIEKTNPFILNPYQCSR